MESPRRACDARRAHFGRRVWRRRQDDPPADYMCLAAWRARPSRVRPCL